MLEIKHKKSAMCKVSTLFTIESLGPRVNATLLNPSCPHLEKLPGSREKDLLVCTSRILCSRESLGGFV